MEFYIRVQNSPEPPVDTILHAPVDTLITPEGQTAQPKTVKFTFDEPAQPEYSTGWTGQGTEDPQGYFPQWKKDFPNNGTYSETFRDTIGNLCTVTIEITGIEDTVLHAPIGTVFTTPDGQSTSFNAPTNQDKILTYTFDEPVQPNPIGDWVGIGTENPSGFYTQWQKTYEQNITETVSFQDTASNVVEVVINITGIDKIAPQITNFSSDNPEWSNQSKTYTVDFTEPVNKPQGWTGNTTGIHFTKTVSANGNVHVSTTDLAGNPVDSTQVETKIDKVNPTLSLSQITNPAAGTATITATASDNESGLADYPYSFDNEQNWTANNEFVVSENGMYYVIARDKAGNKAHHYISVSIGTGIDEIEKAGFKVYPNPANSLLHIETEHPVTNIVITDMLGKTVLNHKGSTTNEQVDVSGLESGLYFVRVRNKVGKFIKE